MLTLAVSTRIFFHEIGGFFDNHPTPDKAGPLQTTLFLSAHVSSTHYGMLQESHAEK